MSSRQVIYCRTSRPLLGPERRVYYQTDPRGKATRLFIVARSGLLGVPYFLDTGPTDAEGAHPVYCAMSGAEVWQPTCARLTNISPSDSSAYSRGKRERAQSRPLDLASW